MTADGKGGGGATTDDEDEGAGLMEATDNVGDA